MKIKNCLLKRQHTFFQHAKLYKTLQLHTTFTVEEFMGGKRGLPARPPTPENKLSRPAGPLKSANQYPMPLSR